MKTGTESFMTDRQTVGRLTGNQKRFQRNFILHHFLNKAIKITCGIWMRRLNFIYNILSQKNIYGGTFLHPICKTILSACVIITFTYNLIRLTCNTNTLTCNLIMLFIQIVWLHININKLQVNILHVDMIISHLSCMTWVEIYHHIFK